MSESQHGRYVREVQEATERCAQALLSENGRLRSQVALLEATRRESDRRLEAAQKKVELADALRALATSLEAEKVSLQRALAEAQRELASYRADRAELEDRLSKVEIDNRRAVENYAEVSQRSSQLANLYVASYRLHEAMERETILEAIREIIINLVGSEHFAILDFDGEHLRFTDGFGIDPDCVVPPAPTSAAILRAARGGDVLVADKGPNGTDPIACVPLRVCGRTTGVIAIFGLLPHKSSLEPVDHELFDLLATQAGAALHYAGLARLDRQE